MDTLFYNQKENLWVMKTLSEALMRCAGVSFERGDSVDQIVLRGSDNARQCALSFLLKKREDGEPVFPYFSETRFE